MKKIGTVLLCLLLIAAFGFFALASTSDDGGSTQDQGQGAVDGNSGSEANLDHYNIEILSCRLAETYDGKPVVIVKYAFTNNSDSAASFSFAFDDNVYQDGIGLNPAYVLKDSANYSMDNQTKEIKPGARLEVEAAYELNDETTDIEVEISELFSWDDTVITKTFSITG